MPRGVKTAPKSIGLQIEELDVKISSLKEKLSISISQRDELAEIKEKEDFIALQTILKEKQMSVEDIMKLIDVRESQTA